MHGNRKCAESSELAQCRLFIYKILITEGGYQFLLPTSKKNDIFLPLISGSCYFLKGQLCKR